MGPEVGSRQKLQRNHAGDKGMIIFHQLENEEKYFKRTKWRSLDLKSITAMKKIIKRTQ